MSLGYVGQTTVDGRVWGRNLPPSYPSYYSSRVMDMPRGRPSPKLAITVDPDVHAQVVVAASVDGVSVSAWMTSAARRALLARDGLRGVAEWEAEHGAFTEAELEAARRRVADETVATSHSRSA
jgi:hypothetical protein